MHIQESDVTQIRDPQRAFYERCLRHGFRYIGERGPAFVDGLHVRMPYDEQHLFARVPVSDFDLLADLHEQRCTDCKGRLFDFYVTSLDASWRHEHYGKFRADHIGRACGSCGKIQYVDEGSDVGRGAGAAGRALPLAPKLRTRLSDAKSIFEFVDTRP